MSYARIHIYHLTVVTGNEKLGPIATTTTSRNSCWEECPFYGKACYGEGFHARMHWDKVSAGERGYGVEELARRIGQLPMRSLLRINQVGDLPRFEDGSINLAEAVPVARAARKRKLKAWGYSHHEQTPGNLVALNYLTGQGITMNASCETEAQVDKVYAAGGLAVLVVDPDEKRTTWKTPGGIKVTVCPEQRGLVANCQACDGYCAQRTINTGTEVKPRGCVAFLGHYAPKQVKKLLKELQVQG